MEFSLDNNSQNNRITEVPLIKNEKNNTKNIIVTILSAEFPLKVRDLFETILEKYKKGITIQGVYKAVKQLEKQRIVEQVKDGYLLSLDWINKFNKYASDLLVIYSANKGIELKNIPNFYSTSVTLKGKFSEIFDYMLNVVEDRIIASDTKNPMISHSYHAWIITIANEKQRQKLKNIANRKKHYILSHGTTVFDVFLLNYWKDQLNSEYRTAQRVGKECDLVVIDDLIFQIYFDRKFRNKWNRLYKKAKIINSEKFSELYRLIFEQDTKVTIIITKNEQLAGKMIKETLRKFYSKIVKLLEV